MPTVIDLERVKGKHVVLKCGGVVSEWESIEFDGKFEIENPQAADAGFKQKVLDITDATATLVVWVGKSNNTFTRPKRGALVTDLEFSISAESIIDPDLLDALKSGHWRVVGVKTSGGRTSTKYTLTIEAGFIDATADELGEGA